MGDIDGDDVVGRNLQPGGDETFAILRGSTFGELAARGAGDGIAEKETAADGDADTAADEELAARGLLEFHGHDVLSLRLR